MRNWDGFTIFIGDEGYILAASFIGITKFVDLP